MAPSPNVPEEIGIRHPLQPLLTILRRLFADFSFFGGAESLSEPKQPPCLPRRTEIPHPQDTQNVYDSMPQDPSDFLWLMTEEPHRSRRKAIMKAHPEVSIDPPSASFLLPAVPRHWTLPNNAQAGV